MKPENELCTIKVVKDRPGVIARVTGPILSRPEPWSAAEFREAISHRFTELQGGAKRREMMLYGGNRAYGEISDLYQTIAMPALPHTGWYLTIDILDTTKGRELINSDLPLYVYFSATVGKALPVDGIPSVLRISDITFAVRMDFNGHRQPVAKPETETKIPEGSADLGYLLRLQGPPTVEEKYAYIAFDSEVQALSGEFKGMVIALDKKIQSLDSWRYKSKALDHLEDCFTAIGKALKEKQGHLNIQDEQHKKLLHAAIKGYRDEPVGIQLDQPVNYVKTDVILKTEKEVSGSDPTNLASAEVIPTGKVNLTELVYTRKVLDRLVMALAETNPLVEAKDSVAVPPIV